MAPLFTSTVQLLSWVYRVVRYKED